MKKNHKTILGFSIAVISSVMISSFISNSSVIESRANEITPIDDNELEAYDRVTLRDVGYDEQLVFSANGRATDFESEVGRYPGVFSYPKSSGNQTSSTALEFVFNTSGDYQGDGDNNFIDIRLGTSTAWKGYKFTISPLRGNGNGHISCGIDDNIKASAPFDFERDKDYLIELGAIDVLSSDLTWLYVKVDGVLVASATPTDKTEYSDPIVSIYGCEVKKGKITFKSTGEPYSYKNLTNLDNFVNHKITNGNAEKGFYFTMPENSIPYDIDWTYCINPMSKNSTSINGVPFGNLNNVMIKKYGPVDYYACIADNGYAARDGETFIFSGGYQYYQASTKTKYVFRLPMLVARYSGGSWKLVNDIYSDIIEEVNNSFDYSDYSIANQGVIENIISEFEQNINLAFNGVELYSLRDEVLAEINNIELDPEAALASLIKAQEEAVVTLNNYVVRENYFPQQYSVIENIISNALNEINNAQTKNQVLAIVEQTKAAIDEVFTIGEYYEDKIINQSYDYKDGLEAYDVTTLTDFNMGEEQEFKAYHAVNNIPDNGNLSNDGPNDYSNLFMPSKENTTSSMVFQFIFNTTGVANGKYDAALFIKLRGISYFGYRFDINNSSGGIVSRRMYNDANSTELANIPNIFRPNTDYEIQVGAIDIKLTNRCWVFVKVNGNLLGSDICDKIDFCVNPRVGISDSHTQENTNEKFYMRALHNDEITTDDNAIVIGGAKIDESYTSTQSGIYFNAPINRHLAFDTSWALGAYPLSNDCVTLNGENAVSPNKCIIKNHKDNGFYLALKDCGINASIDSVLVLKGKFAYYENNVGKVVFEILPTTFIYTADGWQIVETLEDAKTNADFALHNYVNLDDYDLVEREDIISIIETSLWNIMLCNDIDRIHEILQEALVAIDEIMSILDYVRLDAVQELDNYKLNEWNEYRLEEQEEILAITREAKLAIMSCDNEEQIASIVENAKKEIDQVKTDAELKVIELNKAKSDIKLNLEKFYGRINLDLYTDDEVNKINNIVLAALRNMDSASSIEELESIYNQAIADLNKYIGEEAKTNGCGGSITATCALVGVLSSLCAFVCVSKKEK